MLVLYRFSDAIMLFQAATNVFMETSWTLALLSITYCCSNVMATVLNTALVPAKITFIPYNMYITITSRQALFGVYLTNIIICLLSCWCKVHSKTLLCSMIILVYSSGLNHILVTNSIYGCLYFKHKLHSSMAGLSYNNKDSVSSCHLIDRTQLSTTTIHVIT